MSGSLRPQRPPQSSPLALVVEETVRLRRLIADPLVRHRLVVIGAAALGPVVIACGVSLHARLAPAGAHDDDARPDAPVRVIVAAPWTPAPVFRPTTTPPASTTTAAGTTRDALRPGEALSTALSRHGVSANEVSAVLRTLRGAVPITKELTFSLRREGGTVARLVLDTVTADGAPRTVTVARALPATAMPAAADTGAADAAAPATTTRNAPARAPTFSLEVVDAPVDTVVEGLAGTVRTTLAEGILAAGGDAALVDRFVDVFAADVDFYRSTRDGDEFRVLVEKRYASDGDVRRFLGYGRVVAAEYSGSGGSLRSFAFTSPDGRVDGVFDEDGDSRRRQLLKVPIDLAAVPSRSGERFDHATTRGPVHRPSHGIDYGAPLGTPVWSTGDGVVVQARFGKAEGNMVIVDHGGGLSTTYLHLSRFADGIKPGARVRQKQPLGFVGSTGASSGPHLHYGVRRGSAGVDDVDASTPAAAAVPPAYRASFAAFVAPLLAQLRALARA
ncbi:MAG: M23 family metallopeptidase [Deltaproteobacteria bacterium]|nr:M23 family metallopeptidase [Deltaproteobacteria bacterium]